ncbi:MAG TPA: GNAT family N-acetyltransferase [Caulobacteraceae bacterium]|nr:GNAT family N-acetyltransferase [Caulobacteraceae bacterium]
MCMIETRPVIETRRLTLRAPLRADAARMAELANDFDVVRMTSRMPHPYAVKDAEDFIDRCEQRDWENDATFALDLEDEGFVGCLGFFRNDAGQLETGYWIGRPWWGRGLATEALKGALVWASKEWGKRCVTAGHFEDNPASGTVLTKAGFLYTGVVRRQPSLARGGEVPCRMMVWLA